MLRASHVIQLCVIALLGLGVLMIQSASMAVVGPTAEGVGAALRHVLLSRPCAYMLLAVGVMLLATRLDVHELFVRKGWANPLRMIVLFALVLTALTLIPGMGRSVNGASRWLYLGPRSWGISFQPSELVKWTLVLAIAAWCARRRGVMGRFWHGLVPPLVLVGVACGLVVVEDLGTAVLIGAVAVCLLYAGGARWWHLLLIAPVAGAAVVAAIAQSPYRLQRLTAFLDPWQDPAGAGYHPIQSMIAIAQGGLLGRGLGFGVQKFGYLPEDTTDFIFAVICEELGIAGAALVVALYLALLWFGLSVVRQCRHTFGRLVALGVLLTVGLQALINIAVVTVMVPTKGIALPLVSAGGTGWIMTAFALGLVAALDNAHALRAEVGEPSAVLPLEPASAAPPRVAA